MAPFPWQLSATIHPFKDSFHVKCLTIVKLLQMHVFIWNHFSDSEKGSSSIIPMMWFCYKKLSKCINWLLEKRHHFRYFIQQTYHSILDDQLYIQCYCRTSRVNNWGMVFTRNETQYNPFQKVYLHDSYLIHHWTCSCGLVSDLSKSYNLSWDSNYTMKTTLP